MKKPIFFILLASLIGACSANHLVYVHETSLGLDVAASTEGTGRFVLGYDRDTYALVPRRTDGKDAMSLASVGCIYAEGLDQVQFNHFVSSGEAAKKIAQDPDTLEKINNAIQGGGEQCSK
jgi:hypothetical protein